jgi:hypothetical protein
MDGWMDGGWMDKIAESRASHLIQDSSKDSGLWMDGWMNEWMDG